MEVSLCSHWFTVPFPLLSLISHPSSLLPSPTISLPSPSLSVTLLHPSIADPAYHPFIPDDIMQSKNVALFGVGALCSHYSA